jgi:sorbitol-specific phosphotransferase system component IIC
MFQFLKTGGNKIYYYVKDHDMFAHEIRLNFNEGGETFQTTIGGVLSFLVKLFITAYIIIRTKILVFYEGDVTETMLSVEDL